MEDKQKICDLLVPVLQETRDFQELESFCGDFLVRSSENSKCSYGFRNIND